MRLDDIKKLHQKKHRQSFGRFIVEGEGAYTVVDGHKDAILDAALEREGVLAILSKPFDDGELLNLIDQALRAR